METFKEFLQETLQKTLLKLLWNFTGMILWNPFMWVNINFNCFKKHFKTTFCVMKLKYFCKMRIKYFVYNKNKIHFIK